MIFNHHNIIQFIDVLIIAMGQYFVKCSVCKSYYKCHGYHKIYVCLKCEDIPPGERTYAHDKNNNIINSFNNYHFYRQYYFNYMI